MITNGAQKIEEISEKIKKLEARKKQLEAITRSQDRKDRTRRLIQIGAILDSIGIYNLELAEDFKTHFTTNPKSKEWLDNFIANHKAKEKTV